MICPNCGGNMTQITYPNGYMEFECEHCGTGIQDAEMNREYDEQYNDGRCHY